MKEEYWELFMTSGKIDDYLNYKNSILDKEHFELDDDDVWVCSEEYMNKVLSQG